MAAAETYPCSMVFSVLDSMASVMLPLLTVALTLLPLTLHSMVLLSSNSVVVRKAARLTRCVEPSASVSKRLWVSSS